VYSGFVSQNNYLTLMTETLRVSCTYGCNSTSQFQKSFVLNATVAYVISRNTRPSYLGLLIVYFEHCLHYQTRFRDTTIYNHVINEGVSIGSSKCFRICILQFQSCRPYSDQNFGVTKTICPLCKTQYIFFDGHMLFNNYYLHVREKGLCTVNENRI
jgi:hypothetical protein